MNKIKVYDFDEVIIKDFKENPALLKEFKVSIVKDYKKDKDLRAFKENLKIIIKAERGLATKISRQTKIDRAGIYRILSSEVMPRYDTFEKLLSAMGYNINIQIAWKEIIFKNASYKKKK